MTTTWDDKWVDRQHAIYAARVRAAGFHLVNEMRKLISVPSRTVKVSVGKGGKTRKVLGARGSSRSRPGEPPHKDYGWLRKSVAQDFSPTGDTTVSSFGSQQIVAGSGNPTTRVGTSVAYGRFLEFGTSRMAARPWIRRTLKEQRATLAQIIERGGSVSISVS
jgi:HK97 gp10 family phage protein